MDDLELLGWNRISDIRYSHYCGATIAQHGAKWAIKTVAGVSHRRFATDLMAIAYLEQQDNSFWSYGAPVQAFTYGDLEFKEGCSNRDLKLTSFVLRLVVPSSGNAARIPQRLIRNRFFGKAKCARCSAAMSEINVELINEIRRKRIHTTSFLACTCGYPVWQMAWTQAHEAIDAILKGEARLRRRQDILSAGGRHSTKDIREILAIQSNRCIYCNAIFSKRTKPSKDHFLPVANGGGDFALNIVLACLSCNARRRDIPFRTYCRLLSPRQNEMICGMLKKRILALDPEVVSEKALSCFALGLSLHNPKNKQYQSIVRSSGAPKENLAQNSLLPRTIDLLLTKESRERLKERKKLIRDLASEVRLIEKP